ncbi:MAG TPA: hypothetical protein EYN51_11310 [Flavobacteriales bacterium]|nr:hypothetical protein [Flavobacteriales bacterium]
MKRLFTIIAAVLITAHLLAQAPESMSYQAVVRDNSNTLMANTSIGMQISILQGSLTGSAVFVERHFLNTNANGLVSLEIGSGSLISGSFTTIDWENGPYFIKTETDVNGGANYTITGTSQLLSVSYALHATTVEEKQTLDISNDTLSISDGNSVVLPTDTTGSGTEKTYLVLAGDITDAEAVTRLQNDFGPNTQFLWVIGTTQLTVVDLTGFSCTELVEIKIWNNQALTTITLPELTNVWYLMQYDDNPALTNINLPVLEGVAGNFRCYSNDILASLSLPVLASVGGFNCQNNDILASLSLPALTTAGNFYFSTNPVLASLSLPVLASVGDYFQCFYNDILDSLSLPALASVGGNFYCYSNPVLASLSLPVLASVGGNLECYSNPVLASLGLPVLASLGGNFRCYSNDILASLSLPALASVGGNFYCPSNDILASLSLPVLASLGGNFECYSNVFPSSTVNSLLGTLVAISPALTGRIIYLHGQNPSAPPTGQGLTDKATLIANGNTVSTD